jgi:hypothetical protein
MQDHTRQLLHRALELPPGERAVLVERLIASLGRPGPSPDPQWVRETEDRLAAFRTGELDSIGADEVYAELDRCA